MIRTMAKGNAPIIVPVCTVSMTDTPPKVNSTTVMAPILATSTTLNALLGFLAEATKLERA